MNVSISETIISNNTLFQAKLGLQYRYDTRKEFNVIKLSDQLNLAHVPEKNEKEETKKQTKESARLIQCRFKIREGRPEGIRMTMDLYGGKDL